MAAAARAGMKRFIAKDRAPDRHASLASQRQTYTFGPGAAKPRQTYALGARAAKPRQRRARAAKRAGPTTAAKDAGSGEGAPIASAARCSASNGASAKPR